MQNLIDIFRSKNASLNMICLPFEWNVDYRLEDMGNSIEIIQRLIYVVDYFKPFAKMIETYGNQDVALDKIY